MVLCRHPKGGICLFVVNFPRVIQMPKTNDLQLALDYLCRWLVILNNVYLPLVELLLLFCGQDSWPSPFKSSWGSSYKGRVTDFISLWSISKPLSDGLGSCLGVGMMVGEGWVLVSFWSINILIIYSGLSHCCSIDRENSSAVQISEVKTALKKGRPTQTLFL